MNDKRATGGGTSYSSLFTILSFHNLSRADIIIQRDTRQGGKGRVGSYVIDTLMRQLRVYFCQNY